MAPTTTLHVAVLCSPKIGHTALTKPVRLGDSAVRARLSQSMRFLQKSSYRTQPDNAFGPCAWAFRRPIHCFSCRACILQEKIGGINS
ncbi:hypothetical protein BU25DRAFT_409602 [Macroventuria anomochaeta]|uniref:Uncharacterized protein n=1 Tax=Macroventuria anomochaeta TaxID=301207 RepID=A0ACB6S572_9PLEO|nr:uncharacterized protein BU25DRAFT_409602 [Macroventuria anomochaeta]KAF2629132.1 hypothetical protein BU25DRAFT_409602 [Macroventuria anomochaeta]